MSWIGEQSRFIENALHDWMAAYHRLDMQLLKRLLLRYGDSNGW